MGFYDTPLVINRGSQEELFTPSELRTLNEKYDMYNGDDGNNPYLKQLNYQNPIYSIRSNAEGSGNFYTDPNTGNIYTNKEYDFENGTVKYTPYLNIQDLKSDTFLPYLAQKTFNTPEDLKNLVDLKNSNPKEYQKQAATQLGDMAFNLWQGTSPYAAPLFAELEKIKDINPEAYYAADIALKARQMGHSAANGASDQTASFMKSIQDNFGNAVQAGLTPEFINSTVNQNYSTTAADRAKTNAVNAASGGGGFNFGTDMLPGLMLVGGALAGAYGIDSALSAGAASSGGFGLTGASGAGGSMGAGSALQLAPSAGSIGGFGSIAAPSLATGLGVGAGGVLGAGALSAENLAALEAMQTGAGYGLNASQVPDLASGLYLDAAQNGLSAKDALSNINRAKNIAKLLNQDGSQTGANITATNIPTAQQWQQQATQNLAQATPEQFGGLYQMNKNPFTFANPMAAALKNGTSGLDVSGISGQALNTQNQQANLLRMFG